MKPVELLKHNLAIEYDLQNFIGFVLESVNKLGGNPFTAAIASLELMRRLRDAGAGTGYPLPARLLLQGPQLWAQWGEKEKSLDPLESTGCALKDSDFLRAEARERSYAESCVKIANFTYAPQPEIVEQLRQHLLNSTESADPAILYQRNAEMTRNLSEIRARTEKELETLQQTLEKHQSELRESLHQAETDPLTGLLNRRAFDERLGQAFRRTMRQKDECLSLVLFDLDHFKEINDEFGHQYGDAYLNKMAFTLLCVIRNDVDFAFRFGGDEFAMLVFADCSMACNKATHVLNMMEGKVSIGISAISPKTPDGLTQEEFIRLADNALYEAKHQGRGRVVVNRCALTNSSECKSPCIEMTGLAHE